MTTITIRNIPDTIMTSIRQTAEKERRSLNNQILVALEQGMIRIFSQFSSLPYEEKRAQQIATWKEICGKWKGKKSAKKLADDIVSHRSYGRDIVL